MDKKQQKRAKQRFEVLQGEGRRFSFNRLKQAFVFYVLLLLALVVIVQVAYHWLGEQFLSWRLQVVTAEQGVMEKKKEVSGLITREEKVIKAPDYGIILDLADPGQRIPAGKEIATFGVISRSEMQKLREDSAAADKDVPPGYSFYEEIIEIKSEEAGFLSVHLDGWEEYSGSYFKVEEELEEIEIEESVTQKQDLFSRGEPLFKIVNNWQWYYNIVLSLHLGRQLTEHEKVELEFDFAPGEKVAAELYYDEIDEETREVRLTYLVEKQVPGFDQARRAEASLLYSRERGIIIPEEAVFEKEGRSGVYLNQGGRVVFDPVTVIETKEEKVLVEGLEANTLVITRPDLVEEGQRLN
ncbi:MAG: HlyD family efflux transporter periplasmic adaptor subunit [Bacillota bacterium]